MLAPQPSDLGAPLTQTEGSLTWNGVIGIHARKAFTEFTISFDSAGGGKIEAFVPNIAIQFDLLIEGTFDTGGVITGNVHYAAFANSVRADIAEGVHNGVLSGLIGTDGAVGVFVRGTTTDGGNTITGGTGSTSRTMLAGLPLVQMCLNPIPLMPTTRSWRITIGRVCGNQVCIPQQEINFCERLIKR